MSEIRIILVGPSHPGNIGAAARAMRNMGLEQLVLVRPKHFPHPEATARASGAESLLTSARVVDSVAAATEGCGFIAATTSRERDQNFRVLDVREAAARLVREAQRAPVAVLFGAERTGLTNEELESSHALIRIPANGAYASLNLAMAVQLVTYELYRARLEGQGVAPEAREDSAPLASPQEMERLYAHLSEVMQQVEFRDRTQSGTHLMSRIRRFLQRAELDQNEANIVRGLLTAIQNRRRVAGAVAPPRLESVIYLDNAASTPLDPAVAQAMQAALSGELQANPSSGHVPGRAAAALIERARAQVAALIGAEPAEIVFTSGATEADNLAVLGIARANADRGRHIVTSRIEHKALLTPCRQLRREGFEISYLEPDSGGRIDPAAVAAALRPDTVLVSVMHVNNEIGVIEDIGAIGALCRERGIAFHTDAAQSVGKVPLSVRDLPVDFVSFTAHKLHGPKGVGALYVRRSARASIAPIMFGADQESGLRPGTLPTHQIVGFGAAAELAARAPEAQRSRLTALRERLWSQLRTLPGVHLNGSEASRAPHILNVSFEGIDGESLIAALGPLAVSTGSACNSANAEPSYVLRALGRSTQLAESSLRFSVGRFTTEADIDTAALQVRSAVGRLRAVSPAAARWSEASAAAPDQGFAAALPVGWAVQGDGDAASVGDAMALGAGVRRLFETLPHAGELADASGTVLHGEAGGERKECWVRFSLLVSGDTVKDARFRAIGCPHTLAAAEWVARQLAGRTRAEALPGNPLTWADALGVPAEKLGRLLVVEDALRAALQGWP